MTLPDNLKKVLRVLSNKYVIVTLVFVVLMLFVEENNFMVTLKLRRENKQLHQEEAELMQGLATDSVAYEQIRENADNKERLGREEYYMKRADEDIFVIK
ncbi:MAG: hypothetical protein IJ761_00570 [Bacteroidales bacterium]|nr:hypothetical protein [Bacteroidales bacterium]